MWRGYGGDSDSEKPHGGGYFRPRISSISGVLASMTKQRFFTPPTTAIKDDIEYCNPSSSINPASFDPAYGYDLTRINGACLTGARASSPSRSSYGDLIAYSRSASARPSIDSQTAHGIYAFGES